MKKIFIINGMGTSGKDSFISLLNNYIPSKTVSSVDIIKKAARVLGWDGTKTEVNRKFLSDLKFLSEKAFNTSLNYIDKSIKLFRDCEEEILFIHIREGKNIKEVIDKYPQYNIETIIVKRIGAPIITSNEADANVYDYDYDYVLNNDGDLEDLDAKAKGFAEFLREEEKHGR